MSELKSTGKKYPTITEAEEDWIDNESMDLNTDSTLETVNGVNDDSNDVCSDSVTGEKNHKYSDDDTIVGGGGGGDGDDNSNDNGDGDANDEIDLNTTKHKDRIIKNQEIDDGNNISNITTDESPMILENFNTPRAAKYIRKILEESVRCTTENFLMIEQLEEDDLKDFCDLEQRLLNVPPDRLKLFVCLLKNYKERIQELESEHTELIEYRSGMRTSENNYTDIVSVLDNKLKTLQFEFDEKCNALEKLTNENRQLSLNMQRIENDFIGLEFQHKQLQDKFRSRETGLLEAMKELECQVNQIKQKNFNLQTELDAMSTQMVDSVTECDALKYRLVTMENSYKDQLQDQLQCSRIDDKKTEQSMLDHTKEYSIVMNELNVLKSERENLFKCEFMKEFQQILDNFNNEQKSNMDISLNDILLAYYKNENHQIECRINEFNKLIDQPSITTDDNDIIEKNKQQLCIIQQIINDKISNFDNLIQLNKTAKDNLIQLYNEKLPDNEHSIKLQLTTMEKDENLQDRLLLENNIDDNIHLNINSTALNELTLKYNDLLLNNEKLQMEINQINDEKINFINNIENYRTTIEETTDDFKSLRLAFLYAENVMKELYDVNEKLKQDMIESESKYEQLEKSSIDIKQKLIQSNAVFVKYFKELIDLKTLDVDSQSEMCTLQLTDDYLMDTLNCLNYSQSHYRKLNDEYNKVFEKIKEMNCKIEQITCEKHELLNSIDQNNINNENLIDKQNMDVLKVDQLEIEIKNIQLNHEKIIDKMKIENEQLTNEINVLNVKSNEKSDFIQKLESANKSLQTSFEEAREQIKHLQLEITDNTKKMVLHDQLKNNIDEMSSTLNELTLKYNNLLVENEKLQMEINQINDEKNKFIKNIEIYRTAVDESTELTLKYNNSLVENEKLQMEINQINDEKNKFIKNIEIYRTTVDESTDDCKSLYKAFHIAESLMRGLHDVNEKLKQEMVEVKDDREQFKKSSMDIKQKLIEANATFVTFFKELFNMNNVSVDVDEDDYDEACEDHSPLVKLTDDYIMDTLNCLSYARTQYRQLFKEYNQIFENNNEINNKMNDIKCEKDQLLIKIEKCELNNNHLMEKQSKDSETIQSLEKEVEEMRFDYEKALNELIEGNKCLLDQQMSNRIQIETLQNNNEILEKEYSMKMDEKCKHFENEINNLNIQLNEKIQFIEKMDVERLQTIGTLKNNQTLIDESIQLNSKLNENSILIKQLENEKISYQLQFDETTQLLNQLTVDMKELRNEKGLLQEKFDKTNELINDFELKISEHQKAYKIMEQEKNDLRKHFDEIQITHSGKIANLELHTKTVENSYNESIQEINRLKLEMSDYTKTLALKTKELQDSCEKISQTELELKTTQQQLTALQSISNDQLNVNQKLKNELENLQIQYQDQLNAIVILKNEKQTIEMELNKLKATHCDIERKQRQPISDQIIELNKLQSKLISLKDENITSPLKSNPFFYASNTEPPKDDSFILLRRRRCRRSANYDENRQSLSKDHLRGYSLSPTQTSNEQMTEHTPTATKFVTTTTTATTTSSPKSNNFECSKKCTGCMELNKQIDQLKTELKVKHLQIVHNKLLIDNNPLKSEVDDLKKALQKSQQDHQLLHIEMNANKSKLRNEYIAAMPTIIQTCTKCNALKKTDDNKKTIEKIDGETQTCNENSSSTMPHDFGLVSEMRIGELNNELITLKKKYEDSKIVCRLRRTNIQELEQEIVKLKSNDTVNLLQGENVKLIGQLNELGQRLKVLQSEKDQCTHKNTALHNDFQRLCKEHCAMKLEMQLSIDSLIEKNSELERQNVVHDKENNPKSSHLKNINAIAELSMIQDENKLLRSNYMELQQKYDRYKKLYLKNSQQQQQQPVKAKIQDQCVQTDEVDVDQELTTVKYKYKRIKEICDIRRREIMFLEDKLKNVLSNNKQ